MGGQEEGDRVKEEASYQCRSFQQTNVPGRGKQGISQGQLAVSSWVLQDGTQFLDVFYRAIIYVPQLNPNPNSTSTLIIEHSECLIPNHLLQFDSY